MCAKQKRGSVLDLVLAPALLLGPSLLNCPSTARHSVLRDTVPVGSLSAQQQWTVDSSKSVAQGAPP
jgi:hypothetical protein